MPEPFSPLPATLYFKRQCMPCRRLARLVAALSLGTVARVPMDAPEAQAFYLQHPALEGMPVLLDGARVAAGAKIFAALPATVLRHGLRRVLARGMPRRHGASMDPRH